MLGGRCGEAEGGLVAIPVQAPAGVGDAEAVAQQFHREGGVAGGARRQRGGGRGGSSRGGGAKRPGKDKRTGRA